MWFFSYVRITRVGETTSTKNSRETRERQLFSPHNDAALTHAELRSSQVGGLDARGSAHLHTAGTRGSLPATHLHQYAIGGDSWPTSYAACILHLHHASAQRCRRSGLHLTAAAAAAAAARSAAGTLAGAVRGVGAVLVEKVPPSKGCLARMRWALGLGLRRTLGRGLRCGVGRGPGAGRVRVGGGVWGRVVGWGWTSGRGWS